jgi:hypothetical protein
MICRGFAVRTMGPPIYDFMFRGTIRCASNHLLECMATESSFDAAAEDDLQSLVRVITARDSTCL